MNGIPAIDVAHENAVDALHHAVLAHHARAAGTPLLAGLKQQFHPAAQPVADGVQGFCRAQQHGRVGVVPTGVHGARDSRAVGLIFVALLDGQRVHIGAQRNGKRGNLRIDGGDNGVGAVLVRFIKDAGALQFFPHQGGRAGQIPLGFRIHVQLAANAHQFRLIHRRVAKIHFCHLISENRAEKRPAAPRFSHSVCL